ncbi:MAG: glycosyltransferase [Proteobacteria bacterium]|nr:glycosyltransferase [Pseudomonadota bacterium]
MNIWVICQYYPPETGAPSARISGLAKSWLERGEQVTVLTGIPNHPDGVVPPAYQNRPPYYDEVVDGVPVRRHWLYVAPNRGKFKRVFNQISFAWSVLKRNWRKSANRPDVIMASSPSFFCVGSAWLLARRHKAKFIFEVRDLWPAIFVQMGILRPGFIYKVLSALEMFLYRRADAIVTVTRSFGRQISARGIVADKLYTVFNGVSDTDYAAALAPRQSGETAKLRSKLGLSPLTKIVLYIGNHGEAQALGQIIDAARLLVKRTDVVFLFVGSGADKEKLQNYAKGVPNVQFLPPVKHAETWAYYSMADINLVCLKNIPDFDMFIPSKMFEIMAAQSCAVACLRGEGAEIMQESGSAMVVPPEAPDALAEAISTLLDDPARREKMAARGRIYVAKTFLHSLLAEQYLNLMKQLTARA